MLETRRLAVSVQSGIEHDSEDIRGRETVDILESKHWSRTPILIAAWSDKSGLRLPAEASEARTARRLRQ